MINSRVTSFPPDKFENPHFLLLFNIIEKTFQIIHLKIDDSQLWTFFLISTETRSSKSTLQMNIINSWVLEFLPHHLTILRNRFSARFHWFPIRQPSSIFSTTLNFFGGGLLSQTPLQLELTQIWIVKYQRNLILGVLVKILLCNKRREIQRGISDLPPFISVLEFLFKKLIDIFFLSVDLHLWKNWAQYKEFHVLTQSPTLTYTFPYY